MEAIIKRLKRDRRGVSNVIVVMLSLVLIVVIVANVVLWSYQMNQIDWEKTQESIAILDVRETWSYNPSGYNSTGWLSGYISDLTSDDGVYMTFRSYYSGTDTSDFVDNGTSDVDSSPDIGTHSDFTAQQHGPDSIYDTLTEENTGGASNTTLVDAESFEGTWPPIGWSETGNWARESSYAYDGTYSADFDGSLFGSSGYLTSLSMDCSDADTVYVDFWWYDRSIDNDDLELHYYDGSAWDNIVDLYESSDGWYHYTENVTDSQYFVSNFQIRWYAKSVGSSETACVDLVTVKKEVQQDNYELDLEVRWTTADYDEDNEELCIFGGTMESEDIQVDVWNGSAWKNAFTDLSSGWNNVSVSSYLESSTFTIRFKDAMETGDTTRDSWNIDITLLHVWSDEYTLEVEFTGSSNTEDWSQLNWTVNSAWTVGSVNVTLQLYDYTLGGYPMGGDGYMAYISDDTPNTDEGKSQTIDVNSAHFRNATGYWRMKVKGVKTADTQFDFRAGWVEFKVAKAGGTLFTFKNDGPLTSHLVSLWIMNSTVHQRYDISVFVNSGETLSYSHVDIYLPTGQCVVKVVTERGNMAIYSNT